MAVTFKSGFELSEYLMYDVYGNDGILANDDDGSASSNVKHTRSKSFGSLICLYISVIFILMCSIGYFALRTSEENLQEIFPCPFNSDSAFRFQHNWRMPRYCPPAINIFFLKTHKCASSTVQNILMRYGDEKNLSFILPKDSNYIGHPERFTRWLIADVIATSSHFNILCHHLRFSPDAVREVMPPSTIYITILRNPITLFKSMYDYYNMRKFFNETIQDFIQKTDSMGKLNSKRMYDKLGRNQMFFDLGYDDNIWNNETLIHNAIDEVDRNFHLVMIQELFDESLILLKYKLCWSISDIIYLKHNMRSQNTEEHKNESFSRKIENFNAADKMLYDYFYKKLNTLIDSFGRERMEQEVQDLRLWNNIWFNHCVKKMAQISENIPTETKASSSKVYSFLLRDEPIAEICKHLAMEELQYTDKLRTKQKLLYKF